MLDPYTPCRRATRGWAGDLRPSSSPLDTPSRTGLPLNMNIIETLCVQVS
jgi:hypothetical protein